jgi:UDP-N-acetylmuramate dehydrogenase
MNKETHYQFLFKSIGEKRFDEEMKNHTSIRVGGKADIFISPKNVEELQDILEIVNQNDLPLFILGEGTNLIVKDNGLRGVVLSMKKGFRHIKIMKNDKVTLLCGAGLGLSDLFHLCMEEGFTGLEDGAGIPGSLGGALMMNAGTKSWEMRDSVEAVVLCDLNGEIIRYEKREIQFNYRSARLPKNGVVLEVEISLNRGDRDLIKEKYLTNMKRRKESQPLAFPSAGSIFKNPEGEEPAGKIIDELGLKGYSIGGAEISKLHGNFIINKGNATAADIIGLIEHIEEAVFKERGVVLEKEVCMVGE